MNCCHSCCSIETRQAKQTFTWEYRCCFIATNTDKGTPVFNVGSAFQTCDVFAMLKNCSNNPLSIEVYTDTPTNYTLGPKQCLTVSAENLKTLYVKGADGSKFEVHLIHHYDYTVYCGC